MLARLRRTLTNAAEELRFVFDRKQAGFIREARPRFPKDRVPVFSYVRAEPGFEADMAYLARQGYAPIDADELVSFLRGGPVADGAVMVTFDGGHQSVFSRALPVLKGLGLKATAFVVPAWVGRPGRLTWKEIELMRASGFIDVQSNTLTHRTLTARGPADAAVLAAELQDSKRIIEERLPGHRVRHLSIPHGAACEMAVALSHRAGYVSNFWGRLPGRLLNGREDDPFRIVRIPHDYLRRLPGTERVPLAALLAARFLRSLRRRVHA